MLSVKDLFFWDVSFGKDSRYLWCVFFVECSEEDGRNDLKEELIFGVFGME